jgi:hypothetical protein
MPISPKQVRNKYERSKIENLITIIDRCLENNKTIIEIPENLDHDSLINEIVEIYSGLGWKVEHCPSSGVRYRSSQERKELYSRVIFFIDPEKPVNTAYVYVIMKNKESIKAFFSKEEAKREKAKLLSSEEYWIYRMPVL